MTSFMSMEQLVGKYQACDSDYSEPNAALMLEICDLINQKGKSLPREAAFAITRNLNSRANYGAMHALLLLDYCVKNCGYPFHLIISTKEFLNELVRRFPERPTNVTMVHHRILELVQQWNSTLCVTSRYKDDFRHINDMYRLLTYKGYRFPPISKDAAAVLNPSSTFQTEEELEEEDKIAQGAKLQELLRVGTPAALEQANDLMKIMSGYDTERIPNYKNQVEQELNRIEQRAILLNDMLIQKSPNDRHKSDSTLEELLGSAKSAQSRIQKLLSDGEDDERMGRLLELNDLINMVITKHADFKAGKSIEGGAEASAPKPPAKDAPKPQQAIVSLIDLDDWGAPGPGVAVSGPVGSSSTAPSNNMASLMDALGDLNFSSAPMHAPQQTSPSAKQLPAFSPPGANPSPYDAFGSMTPTATGTPNSGFRMPMQQQQPQPQQPFSQPFSAMGQFASGPFGGGSGPGSAQGGGTPVRPATPVSTPNNPGNLGWGGGTPNALAFGSNVGTPPMQSQQKQPPLQQQQQQPQQQQQRPDPFGGVDLFASASAPGTPPATGSVPGTPPTGSTAAAKKESTIFDKNGLQIKYRLIWKGNAWAAQAVFINVTPVPFTNLAFQVAAPKSMTLHMETASGSVVPPLNTAQVTQGMHIMNPSKEPLRIRFKVTYAVNGAVVNETGEYLDS
ncbi:hypothetical protein HDU87_008062 [Geranomyces variabilis]|uniref:Uncharacterized protein n=1 Tax=Geranomyces variabilis TaxID=109894 RepID=A0AAD5XUP4_9FUNG|nr:hypothetical protein HDU87_008062 [Geranomyces variabilis]